MIKDEILKDKILIGILTIKIEGGGKEGVKDYIISFLNSLPGDASLKTRRAAAGISAYGSYERGLFSEELLAEALERIANALDVSLK